MNACSPIQDMAAWLDERVEFLRHLETEANDRLLDQKDDEGYRQLMLQKALFVSALPDEAADFVARLPDRQRQTVEDTLARFAAGADNALNLESIFYMSALLYPDDYQEGDPNNLERLASEVRSWL